MCISKILTDLCAIKTKNKNKKYFCKCCLQCFSSEKVLIEHNENCLVINGKQSVKLKSGSISFRNYFKQLHLIIKEMGQFDVKVSIIPNGLEKYMAFTINKNLVFIDSMQFMNSSLDSLVKNL